MVVRVGNFPLRAGNAPSKRGTGVGTSVEDQLYAVARPGRTTAQDLTAEVGVDMSVFATPAHLLSWAKFCPQVEQSAGKTKGRNSRGRGNRYLAVVLGGGAGRGCWAGVLGGAAVGCRQDQDPRRRPPPCLAKRRGKGKAQVGFALGTSSLEGTKHLRVNDAGALVSLERPGSPRVARGLGELIAEANTGPTVHLLGDRRPIIYQVAAP